VDGKPVGMSKLVPMQHRNSHIVYLGGVAIDPAAGGKGYGAIMLQQVIDYAVKMGSLRIELSVATNNKRAIGLYQKLGFVQEGLFKKFSYLKSENIYLDEIFMAWIKEEN
jgi:putative acetyltransferase